MKAVYQGAIYDVEFTYHWHRPALDRVVGPRADIQRQRIKQTTGCVIRRADDPVNAGVLGQAHCSARDTYRFMKGNRDALRHAVQEACATGYLGPELKSNPFLSFARQVLPSMAQDQRARTVGRTVGGARRLHQQLAKALAEAEAIQRKLQAHARQFRRAVRRAAFAAERPTV